MKILNKLAQFPKIFHFAGNSKQEHEILIRHLFNKNLDCSANITILTLFTNKIQAMLAFLLEKNNIKYLNVLNENYNTFFKHKDKMKYYYKALQNVKTDYVLILDAYDVLFYSFDNLLKDFEAFNCDLLFNACALLYPSVQIEKTENEERYSQFNSGICLAKTEKAILFYKDACDLSEQISNLDPRQSELFVFRHLYKTKKYNVKLDYDCILFANTLFMTYDVKGNDYYIRYNPYEKKETKFRIPLYNIDFPKWVLNKNILRNFNGMSVNWYYLECLIEYLEKNKCKNILDLGVGDTSLIIDLYCKAFNKNYIAIDNDLHYVLDYMKEHDCKLNYLICEMVKNDKISYYKDLEKNFKEPFDLISIDGPFGFNTELPRTNILELAKLKLIKEGGVIFLHDYWRTGEQNLIKELNKLISFKLNMVDPILPFVILTNIKYNESL